MEDYITRTQYNEYGGLVVREAQFYGREDV